MGEDLIFGTLGKCLRQNRLLRIARNLELVLQGDQGVPRRQCRSPLLEMGQRPLHGDLQVLEVNRLGDEIERSAVHRRTDVLHVTVCRNDDAPNINFGDIRYLIEQRETIHARHIYVRDNHIDFRIVI